MRGLILCCSGSLGFFVLIGDAVPCIFMASSSNEVSECIELLLKSRNSPILPLKQSSPKKRNIYVAGSCTILYSRLIRYNQKKTLNISTVLPSMGFQLLTLLYRCRRPKTATTSQSVEFDRAVRK